MNRMGRVLLRNPGQAPFGSSIATNDILRIDTGGRFFSAGAYNPKSARI
jgi:hypothetical protein